MPEDTSSRFASILQSSATLPMVHTSLRLLKVCGWRHIFIEKGLIQRLYSACIKRDLLSLRNLQGTDSSGSALRISSGRAAIAISAHSRFRIPEDPFKPFFTVFLRGEKSARTTSAYLFLSFTPKIGGRGVIFTTIECTCGFGEKQEGGSVKHCCTVAYVWTIIESRPQSFVPAGAAIRRANSSWYIRTPT